MPDAKSGGIVGGVIAGATTGAAIGANATVGLVVSGLTAGAIASESVPVVGTIVGAVLALVAGLVAVFTGGKPPPAMSDADIAHLLATTWDLEDDPRGEKWPKKMQEYAGFLGRAVLFRAIAPPMSDPKFMDLVSLDLQKNYGKERVLRIQDGPMYGLSVSDRAHQLSVLRVALGRHILAYWAARDHGAKATPRGIYRGYVWGTARERSVIARAGRTWAAGVHSQTTKLPGLNKAIQTARPDVRVNRVAATKARPELYIRRGSGLENAVQIPKVAPPADSGGGGAALVLALVAGYAVWG